MDSFHQEMKKMYYMSFQRLISHILKALIIDAFLIIDFLHKIYKQAIGNKKNKYKN
jgi:hypothetical protein